MYEGFLVSVTWIEPRMRLKLSDVLHSTASNVNGYSRALLIRHRGEVKILVFTVSRFSPLAEKA